MLRVAVRKNNPSEIVEAGDYCIFELGSKQDAGFFFMCPHEGCGDESHVPLAPMVERGWKWDEAARTLSPSIQRRDPRRCEHHFSLINGEWVP